jgi:uncharacterized protein (DUF1778 family)
MAETKVERLQVRVDETSKRLLEEAADAAHLSTSAFVLQAASQRAEEILAERTLIRLNAEGAGVFAEALTRPAQVNLRLRTALERPVKVEWLD